MELDMDMVAFIEREILHLGQRIAAAPEEVALHRQRAKLYFKLGMFDKALNDFLRVAELDAECSEAAEYIDMIREIFEFRHKDIYNP